MEEWELWQHIYTDAENLLRMLSDSEPESDEAKRRMWTYSASRAAEIALRKLGRDPDAVRIVTCQEMETTVPDFHQAIGAIPLQEGMPTATEAIRQAREEG